MIESVLGAWSLASLLSRFYALMAGGLALLVLGTQIPLGDRPSEVVAAVFDLLEIPPPALLASTSQWIVEREASLSMIAGHAVAFALLWSFAHLWNGWWNWDRVRGPATFWVGLALLTEAQGTAAVEDVPKWTLKVILVVVMLNGVVVLVKRGRGRHHASGDWAATAALVALLVGVLFVPIYVPIALVHALGGLPTPPKRAAAAEQPLERGPATAIPAPTTGDTHPAVKSPLVRYEHMRSYHPPPRPTLHMPGGSSNTPPGRSALGPRRAGGTP